MVNRLINSLSPYLLLHANNPVDWYPWGSEAFEKSIQENKPILLSIGYSACHWCHVMARESFENLEIADYINQHFVPIKVDREERPDIDEIYMKAVVQLTGHGGWPLTVFLTPNREPFFGGTYFPPTRKFNLPGFLDVLMAVREAWVNKKDLIGDITAQLLESMKTNNNLPQYQGELSRDVVEVAADKLLSDFDWNYGGWGKAPKFPHPLSLEFLIRQYLRNPPKNEYYRAVEQTLYSMSKGGMYDLVGGGFCRYSTDNLWQIPHFEKMLYDNVLLGLVYLHAYLIKKNRDFRYIVDEIAQFLLKSFREDSGLFFCSIGADSEGVEGKFYLWTQSELQEILGKEDYLYFAETHHFIPVESSERIIFQRIANHDGTWSINPRTIHLYKKLYCEREKRIHPDIDTKVITSWNGLALSFFSQAAWYLSDKTYEKAAINLGKAAMKWLYSQGKLWRIKINDRVATHGMLEDYASLCLGFLDLYQLTGENTWFTVAHHLSQDIIDKFSDPEGGFFDTTGEHDYLLYRTKSIEDSAIPSSNAMAFEAIYKITQFLLTHNQWDSTYLPALQRLTKLITHYPLATSSWLCLIDSILNGSTEIVLIGSPTELRPYLKALRSRYKPGLVLARNYHSKAQKLPPLLENREKILGQPTAYICSDGVCHAPLTNIHDYIQNLDRL